MIIEIKHITATSTLHFESSLERNISILQDKGLNVEVQYAMQDGNYGSMNYTALIIGRKSVTTKLGGS